MSLIYYNGFFFSQRTMYEYESNDLIEDSECNAWFGDMVV